MGIDQVVVGADCPMRHFDGPRLVGRQDEARKNGSVARQCVGVAGVHLNGANHRCQETHKQFIYLSKVKRVKRGLLPERMMIGGLSKAPVAVLARHRYSAEWTSVFSNMYKN